MATTGCPSGEVQTRLRLGQFDEALKAAAALPGHLRQGQLLPGDHGPRPRHRAPGPRRADSRSASKLGIPPVVTNDSHYTYEVAGRGARRPAVRADRPATSPTPTGSGSSGSGYYLKSADEMRAVDSSEPVAGGLPQHAAGRRAGRHRRACSSSTNLMPRFPVPEGETEETWFRKEAWAGHGPPLPGRHPDDVHRQQAEYEMGVIIQMGFPSYFLVVADFIQWAKSNGIAVGPGRGSAAGSLVAYAMGITDLDPMPHGLIFERFLNPERVSMPDVDIDFDERRRGEVIRYVTDKWGEDKVAQIATFGTIKAKAAIKDSARVLGYPYAMGDRITKAMPPAVMGKGIPLSGIFDPKHPRYSEAGEIRRLYESDADVKKVIDTARGHRGPDPADRRARRRRHHVRRADHRPHPADAPRRRRGDHHAVRLPDLRDARPAEDGLPGPAQPDDHRRRGQEHRAQPRHEGRPAGAAAGRQAGLRAARPAATPSACSSSTAGRCARCCG